MKKKINLQFLLIAGLTIALTLAMVVGVFYKLFKREVMENVKTYANVLEHLDSMEEMEEYARDSDLKRLRITMIDPEGVVLYDTSADIAKMENHSGRQEVREAMSHGKGQAIRQSNTLGKSTFYYAVRLNNGAILRVAKEADSILSIFYSAIPSILVIAVLLFTLCILSSKFLTESILWPINQMAHNLGHGTMKTPYKELVPFIKTIEKQHEDIVKNTNMRQEFTANVSHELKTPLTAISGYSELIENGMVSGEDLYRFAGEIHKSSNRLLRMINDIIRLSELDTMTLIEVPYETLNLYNIAVSCVDMLRLNAKNQQVTIQISGEPCQVYGNREMMEELIYNLCDNAIRYNNTGGMVKVSVRRQWLPPKQSMEEEQSKNIRAEKNAAMQEYIVLEVKDTGIGIPKEDQSRIYERFYRVDRSRSKEKGGTGLGLAIVKHIVAQHKAYLELESEVGVGTIIRVIFTAANRQ